MKDQLPARGEVDIAGVGLSAVGVESEIPAQLGDQSVVEEL